MSASKPQSFDPATAAMLAPLASDLRAHLQSAWKQLRELLDGRAPLTKEQRQSLEVIEREAAQLGAIVDELEQRSRKAGTVVPKSIPPRTSAVDGPVAPARVLIAEDDEDILMLLKEIFAEHYALTLARDGGAAFEHLQKEKFHLALVDVQLPVLDGFQLVERLRESPKSVAPPAFMYLSGQASPKFKVRGLSLGASDYVTKPFDPDELLARVQRILNNVSREEHLRLEALTDSLTGLANYRSFTDSLEREFARSRRHDQPLSLLTVDLDRLKSINDDGGHVAGNEAIRLVAQALKDGVRSFEVVGRQGGDEFGVVLPNTSQAEALILSERLRARVAENSVKGHALSISVGIATLEPQSRLTMRQLIEASDEALYASKRAGRNRVSSSAGIPKKKNTTRV